VSELFFIAWTGVKGTLTKERAESDELLRFFDSGITKLKYRAQVGEVGPIFKQKKKDSFFPSQIFYVG
jgi:hypothetical protein